MHYIIMCRLEYYINRTTLFHSFPVWDLASVDGGCRISTSCFVLGKHNFSHNHPKEPLRNFNSGKKNRIKSLDKQSEPQFLPRLFHSSS